MPTFSIKTLGCKVNQYESHAISTMVRALGFFQAEKNTQADLLVINTCCITTAAMSKSRQAIRKALRTSPEAHVFVAGCYGDFDRPKIESLLVAAGARPDRIAIAGHHEDTSAVLRDLAERLADKGDSPNQADQAGQGDQPASLRKEECMKAGGPGQNDRQALAGMSTSIIARRAEAIKAQAPGTAHFDPIDRFSNHQRAFVKIQDGCDAFCSYCVVPFTRPRVWSRDTSVIFTECRNLVSAGHREIVLCGVFLGAYGRNSTRRDQWDDSPSALPDLLAEVARIPDLWRVRLSSIEPGDLTEQLLAVYQTVPTVAPHLHLPLQSGSDNILVAMNRQYRRDEFLSAIDALRDTLDKPAISADIIVGFPGETEDDFQQTLDVAQRAGFCKIHAFPFSAIEGSAAWAKRHQAPNPDVVKDRMRRLGQLEKQLAAAYRAQFVGQTMDVLVEKASRRETTTRHGMTDRYLTVRFAPLAQMGDPTGLIVPVHINTVTDEGLSGTQAG